MTFQTIRSFISIDIEEQSVINKIREIQTLLEDTYTKIKFVELENLHITLRFLGEINRSQINELITALNTIKEYSFRVHFKSLGVFPSIQRARVIWIGIDDNEGELKLKELSIRINQIIDKLRMGKKDKKGFTPHLTIGRIKTRPSKRLIEKLIQNADVDIGEIEVRDFRLKQSILTPKGPIYKTLHTFKLL